MAIVGDSRIRYPRDALVPYLLAEGSTSGPPRKLCALDESTLENGPLPVLETRAARASPKHRAAAVLQITMISVADNSDCAQCPFPEQMQKCK